MNSSVTFKKVLLVAALTAIATPSLVHAATPATTAVQVQYADLNLANPAGLDTLYSRISNASRAVCGNQSDLKMAGSLKQLRVNNECYENTLSKALAEVNFPGVAQARAQ